jgi:hypothetical protein
MSSCHGNSLSYCAREAHVTSGLSIKSVVCISVTLLAGTPRSVCQQTACRSLQSQGTRHKLITTGTNCEATRTSAHGAMAQGICHPPVTPEDTIGFQVSSRGIYGEQSGIGTGFSLSTSAFPPSVSFHLRSTLTDSPTTDSGDIIILQRP